MKEKNERKLLYFILCLEATLCYFQIEMFHTFPFSVEKQEKKRKKMRKSFESFSELKVRKKKLSECCFMLELAHLGIRELRKIEEKYLFVTSKLL
jgi:hypothetical protein